MELVWFGGIKSQIKRKVNSKLWDLCQLCSIFYWSVACGAFQGVCPSGVLPSTCYPLEQGNGLLKILCSLPQPAPNPMPCGMSQCDLGAGLESAAGTQSLSIEGIASQPQHELPSEDTAHLASTSPGSFPKTLTLFHSPNIANRGKTFCI